MPPDYGRAHAALVSAVDEVQAYEGSQGIKDVAAMLDRLVDLYRVQMGDLEGPDAAADFIRLQAAHKQCLLLRASLAKSGEMPTIL